MIESPVLQELFAERDQNAILRVLKARFKQEVPADIVALVRGITDLDQLEQRMATAAECVDLDAFRQALQAPA